MASLRLLPTFVRELVAPRTLPREPEPELMIDSEQVQAYAHAGRIDGPMAAAYLFHTARVSQVIAGCETVLDLGCGPATQLAQIAQLNPRTHFIGVDLSPTMLGDAARHLREVEVGNVALREGNIARLDFVADRSVDAVISTMTLHHLPKHELLADCFSEMSRVLKPGGALYLTDFGRLKSLKSVLFFAYRNAKHQPHLFTLDTERSLRAAFLKEDFEALVAKHFQDGVLVESTFKVPFLVIVKTADKSLPAETRERLRAMRGSLSPRYQQDLKDIRTFFALGGLGNDPFAVR